jgi:hypothetical protein
VPAQLLNCREIVGSTKRARLGAPATAPCAQPPSLPPRRGKEARDAVTALVTSRALPLAASRAIGRTSSDDSRQTVPCVRRDRSGNERVPRSVTVTAERARRVRTLSLPPPPPPPRPFPTGPLPGNPDSREAAFRDVFGKFARSYNERASSLATYFSLSLSFSLLLSASRDTATVVHSELLGKLRRL